MQQLLLLHGAIGAKDQLERFETLFNGHFIVHRINFNGHGGEAYRSFSIKDFADDVSAYMQANNIGVTNIFGYSMGGYVAMYLAKYHPDKINKIVTLATKFSWNEAIAAKEIKMLDAAVIEEKIPAFAKTLAERHAPNDWKTVLERTADMLTSMGKRNVLSLEEYATIEKRVLVMLGDRDKMVTLEETVAVYKNLPKGALMILPDTGHPIEKVELRGVVEWIMEN